SLSDFHGFAAVLGHGTGIAFVFQQIAEGLANTQIIFGDQNINRGTCRFLGAHGMSPEGVIPMSSKKGASKKGGAQRHRWLNPSISVTRGVGSLTGGGSLACIFGASNLSGKEKFCLSNPPPE